MNDDNKQGLTTEQFFYFFARLRKGEVRRTVASLKQRYSDESPDQLAMRLVNAKSNLAMLGGLLLTVPALFPAAGLALKMAGVVGATSLLTRMNLYLILEIALVYGKDIDDRQRVAEMMAVVAATGTAAAVPLLMQQRTLNPLYALPSGTLSSMAATRLVGHSAMRFYRRHRAESVAGV